MGMRSFIAVPVSQQVLDLVRTVQNHFRRLGFSFRWVKPEQTHLTLKFMADLAETDQAAVWTALRESGSDGRPFSLSVRGIGVFPNVRNPRVLWLGMSGDVDRLVQMQRQLDRSIFETTDHRIPIEDRPFKPHLTIARISERIVSDHLVTALRQYADIASEPFTVTELHWIESRLTPSGPIYRILKRIEIGRTKQPEETNDFSPRDL